MESEAEHEPPELAQLLRRERIRGIFGISDKTVTRWIQKGLLLVIEVAGTQRFHPDDIDRLFRARFRRGRGGKKRAGKPRKP
jgi:DNA-binding transcriptional MerR regulator